MTIRDGLLSMAALAFACSSPQGHGDTAPAVETVEDEVTPAPSDHTAAEQASYEVSDEPSGPVEYLWARTFGGSSYGAGWGVALTPSGSTVVVGAFEGSIDLNPGPDLDEHISSGDLDAFIVLLDGEGDFQWGFSFGGPNEDTAREVAVRPDGSIAIAGCFEGSVDLDPGPGQDVRSAMGESDAFAMVLEPDGSLRWLQSFGGSGIDCALRVETRSDGAVIVSGGHEASTDFDPGPGQALHRSAGELDAFVAVFDSSGAHLWSHAFGGSRDDIASALGVSADGSVIVGGWFDDTVDFDPGQGSNVGQGSNEHVSTGLADAFAVKYSDTGALVWSRALGGTMTDKIIAVTVGPDDAITLVGSFDETADLDPGPGARLYVSKGAVDAFIVRLDENGDFTWAQVFGEELNDDGVAVTALTDGSVMAALQGQLFLAHLAENAVPLWTWDHGLEIGACEAWSMASSQDGTVVVTGVFRDPMDFDPTAGADQHTPSNDFEPDAFVFRLQATP